MPNFLINVTTRGVKGASSGIISSVSLVIRYVPVATIPRNAMKPINHSIGMLFKIAKPPLSSSGATIVIEAVLSAIML